MKCDGDMNREALIESIAEKSGRSAADVDDALELVLREIGSVLASGESVSLGGYGVFVPHYAKPRRQSGERTSTWHSSGFISERKTLEFKPRKDFIDLLNQQNSGKSDFN